MLGPCWRYVGSFFALGRVLCVLGCILYVLLCFVVALGRFFRVLGRSGLDFGGLQGVRGGFGRLLGPVFASFLARRNDLARKTSILEKPLKTSTGAIKFKVRALTPYAKIDQKTEKTRTEGLSNPAVDEGRNKNWPWGSPGSILQPLGRLLDVPWASLGRSWAPLGHSWALLGPLWALLGCFLDALWRLLGASWASWVIFDRFWTLLRAFQEGLEGLRRKIFGHIFRASAGCINCGRNPYSF